MYLVTFQVESSVMSIRIYRGLDEQESTVALHVLHMLWFFLFTEQ